MKFGNWLPGLIGAGLLLGSDAGRAADTPPADTEPQRQAAQMAQELLSSVLEVQLRQLRENGLESRPIYAEIEAMRQRMDQLVHREMADVVRLLAAGGDDAARRARYAEARSAIREVVTRLAAERQRVARRLRIAALASQTRRILEEQTRALTSASALPALDALSRGSRLHAITQDQRDIQAQLVLLGEALDDVREWGGPAGAAAGRARLIFVARQPAAEAQQAVAQLERTDLTEASLSEAAAPQRAVLQALQAMLAQLEAAQSLDERADRGTVARLNELRDRERQVWTETKRLAPTDMELATRLTDRQLQIRRDLAALAPAPSEAPEAGALIEQATAAAEAAERALFEADREAALRDQAQVMALLERLAELLHHSGETERPSQSAEQMAARTQALRQADRKLSDIRRAQQQAAAEADSDRPAAQAAERRVAQQLAQLRRAGQSLPPEVGRQLEQSQRQVEAAAEALGPSATGAAASELSASAESSLGEAQQMLRRHLADAARRQIAATVGELSRAAEALERTIASEREIEKAASTALTPGQPRDEQALRRLSAEQSEIRQVATLVAQGVKQTAPAAATALEPAAEQSQALEGALSSAHAGANEAAQAGRLAATIHRSLVDAAAQLRDRAAQEANRLARANQRGDAEATRDLSTALAELVAEQQTARADIDRQAQGLVDTASKDPGGAVREDSPLGRAAIALDRAAQEFADALRATGETASELAGQRALGNVPLRQALESASRLALAAEANAAERRAGDAPGAVAPATPSEVDAELAASHLGDELTPASPAKTAQQIAGPDALRVMRRVLSDVPPNPDIPAENDLAGQADQGQRQPGRGREQPGKPRQAGAAPRDAAGGTPSTDDLPGRAGRQAAGQQTGPAGLSRSAAASAAAQARGDEAAHAPQPRTAERDPWFARLPPEMRQAIQARAARPAPRGYQERLDRFFESPD